MLIKFYYGETDHWVLSESLSTSYEEVEAFLKKENYTGAQIMSVEVPIENLFLAMLRCEKTEQTFFKAAGIKIMKLKS